MGDTKLDVTVAARRIDLAEIKLKRVGGALMGQIKSEPLHRYIKGLVEHRVAGNSLLTGAAQTILAAPAIFPEMRTYRNADLTAVRDMCGTAQMTGEDGVFHIIRPSQITDYLIQRSEPLLLSILPLCGPHVETGEWFRINSLLTTRQMRVVVKGWRGFIENIHREHAVPVVVGVKIITEEYYIPLPETEEKKELAHAAAE